ncbi:hypothetical protein G6M87_11105 [Rhizobium rhizogenes]|uniref:hypothetical protein n=1 Tax=Rhizobium rhizogenes TaxID=359 RepID=UPI001572ADC3|nr:hypothetical protein [Rhizobium rhizogenes]NTI22407.1 hypothetical protein [Rhizobium rhizogenes]QTG05990.1 hypothetical protein G6M87_11105 [Rhizobium rhizogenes]
MSKPYHFLAARLKRERLLENAARDVNGHRCDVLLFAGDIVTIDDKTHVIDGEMMSLCRTLKEGYEFFIDMASVEVVGRAS